VTEVRLTVNGRGYDIVCDAGDEERLQTLAREIDRRVAQLTRSVGQIGDARLLLMAGLLVADELAEAKNEVSRAQGERTREDLARGEIVADAIEKLAQRIEALAARLEAA